MTNIIKFPKAFKTPAYTREQLQLELASYWVLPDDRREYLETYQILFWGAGYLANNIHVAKGLDGYIRKGETDYLIQLIDCTYKDITIDSFKNTLAQYRLSFRAPKDKTLQAYVLIKPPVKSPL